MNIPKCTNNGLIPCPSSGVTANLSRGLARKVIIPRKNAKISEIIPVVNGAVCFREAPNFRTNIIDIRENTRAMKSKDPALPA